MGNSGKKLRAPGLGNGRKEATKLLQTTSLEALGIFIYPWKYWFVSLLLSPSMLQTKAPIPSCHLAVPPLWHWAASVLCGFMKVAHQSHDVIHSLLTTISSGLSSTFNSTNPSLQKGFSIKVSHWSRRLFFSSGLQDSFKMLHIFNESDCYMHIS